MEINGWKDETDEAVFTITKKNEPLIKLVDQWFVFTRAKILFSQPLSSSIKNQSCPDLDLLGDFGLIH